MDYIALVAFQKPAADNVASNLLSILSDSSPYFALFLIYIITCNRVGNAAAVALLLPIAAAVAQGLTCLHYVFYCRCLCC